MSIRQSCEKIRTNAVLSVSKTLHAVQPVLVTVEECKTYIRVDTTEDDSVIDDLLLEAIEWVERRCGISIRHYNISAYMEVMNSILLPYGPIINTPVVTNNKGDNITTTVIISGVGNVWIEGYGQLYVAYEAGGQPLPAILKGAILSYVAFCYENRGDNLELSDNNHAVQARQKVASFRQNMIF